MAGRDYIRCKSCDCKLVYDGDDNIRDDLDATYGTCDLICPSCLDALEIRLAKLEQAPAVEPAQRCNCCGYLVTDSEHKGCLRAAKQEPAQAVPVGYCLMPREPTQWMREQIACGIESNSVADVWGRLIRAVDIENKHRAKEPAQAVPVAWKHDCAALLTNNVELWIDACPHCGKPRSAPPAIDDETKRMVLELCRLIIDKAGPDSMITRAMAQKAEKISERLEAGE